MRVIKFRAWDIEDKKMLYFNGIFNLSSKRNPLPSGGG